MPSPIRPSCHAARTLLVAAPMLLAACSDPVGPPQAPLELTALPRALTVAEQETIAASNDFSLALLRTVAARRSGENVFISPFSAAVALGMALNGADGETFEAMRATLGLAGRSREEIGTAYHGLADLLLSLDPSVTIRSANAIFHDADFTPEPAFLARSRADFDAEVRGIDFANQPAALATINGWANEATEGLIPRTLDVIEPEEVLFLMNALYFKGSWRSRFDPAHTATGTFHLDDGSEVQVPLMKLDAAPVRIGYADGVELLELPYGNGAYAMTVVLPPRGTPIDAFVASLAPASWTAMLATMQEVEGTAVLPRFSLAFKDEWTDVLTTLGMGIAFDPDRADFTRIADVRPRNLYLTRVKQDAVVEVNEEGTQAAAVSTVGAGLTSAGPSVTVDRPFVFAIRERLSGTVLFVGKVERP